MTQGAQKFMFELDFGDPKSVDAKLQARIESKAVPDNDVEQCREIPDSQSVKEAEVADQPLEDEETGPDPTPAPTFSEEDLANARQEGFEAGQKQGVLDAKDSAETVMLNTLTNIQQHLQTTCEQQKQLSSQAHKDAIAIASTLVAKALPAFAKRGGTDEIMLLVETLLDRLHSKPRLTINVPADQEAAISEKLRDLADHTGFEGKIIIKTDPELGPSDCAVHWFDGSAERSLDETWDQIRVIIAEHLGQSEYLNLEAGQNVADTANREETTTRTPAEDDVQPDEDQS